MLQNRSCSRRHSAARIEVQHELCFLNDSNQKSSVLRAQLPLEARFTPTPAPVSAVPAHGAASQEAGISTTAPAPATTAASKEATISMAAPAPQAAPAPGSEALARALAPASIATRQGPVMKRPAAALAPAAASKAASISATAPAPAPVAASKEAILNATAATPEAEQTTRELYNTQVHTCITLSLQLVSLILLSCIVHIKRSASTCFLSCQDKQRLQ